MIVTYLRSSSYNTDEWCTQKYFLRYVMGMEEPSNQKADKGTIVHKAMECLAHKKLAEQEDRLAFVDDCLGELGIGDCDPEHLTEMAYNYYTKRAKHHLWTEGDLKDCHRWVKKALTYNNGLFDPRKRHIIAPEQMFDFTIEKAWAHYDFVTPYGEKLSGQLAIRGTIDLVTLEDHMNLLEMVDWKTGRRLNWATGKVKDFEALRKDPQLRIYHYAMSKIYPEMDEFLITIFFINDGGAFTIPFYRSDLATTEIMIKKKFDKLCSVKRPRQNITWKCEKICHFGKTKFKLPDGTNSGLTICEYMKQKVDKEGIDQVMREHGKKGYYGHYQAPGQ